MTLATTIVVKDPVPVEPLFHYAQSLLGDPDRQTFVHITPSRTLRPCWLRRPARSSQVCAWLDERHAKYEWQNEFTGEWYNSALDAHHLGDPAKGKP